MTDPAGPTPRRRKPPPRVKPAAVYGSAAALFVVAAGGIAAQIATGRDPALGAAKPAARAVPVVTVKHIKKTIVVTKVIHDPSPAAAKIPTYIQPPVQSAPAAAPVPQPAAAPTPAPAPAQPTTRSS